MSYIDVLAAPNSVRTMLEGRRKGILTLKKQAEDEVGIAASRFKKNPKYKGTLLDLFRWGLGGQTQLC